MIVVKRIWCNTNKSVLLNLLQCKQGMEKKLYLFVINHSYTKKSLQTLYCMMKYWIIVIWIFLCRQQHNEKSWSRTLGMKISHVSYRNKNRPRNSFVFNSWLGGHIDVKRKRFKTVGLLFLQMANIHWTCNWDNIS